MVLNGLKEEKKKPFKCRATLKQSRASAKELEWRRDCFFLPQSAILTTPKTASSWSYFAEISQSHRCLAAAPMSADESYTNENTASMKVRLWLHKSKKVQLGLFAACFSLNHKKINDDGYKHVFFFFTWTIKIQSGDQIIHKLLCLLDISMSQYNF